MAGEGGGVVQHVVDKIQASQGIFQVRQTCFLENIQFDWICQISNEFEGLVTSAHCTLTRKDAPINAAF